MPLLFGVESSRDVVPSLSAANNDFENEAIIYQRAAALTYYTAPYPIDTTEGIFEAMLMLTSDHLNPNRGACGDMYGAGANGVTMQARKGWWLGRAWNSILDYSSQNLLLSRQTRFMDAFARQLELNPLEESSTVMLSCECSIISGGKLYPGLLHATNTGLYFCSSLTKTQQENAARATRGEDDCDVAAKPALRSDTIPIKDRVFFTDVAALLPSISLEQESSTQCSAAPFLQGVPNAVVVPTALQVFTVRYSTILQFVGIRNVTVKPPRKATGESEQGSRDTVPDAPCTDVVRKHELSLINALPRNLEALKFCAVLWRLWAQRLQELGQPLLHPSARYADPH